MQLATLRLRSASLCLAACLLSTLPCPELACALSLTEALVDDASLNSVQMLDARRGWAVGDHGAILSTDDGGATWRTAIAPVRASLQAVSFVDARRGWAVGGLMQPSTRLPVAVVLRTENGGRSWAALPQPTMPALRAVRFFDDKRGMAAGIGSAFSPGGVFVTHDGGKSWRSLATDQPWAWNAADFRRDASEYRALLGGPRGLTGRSLAGRIEPSQAVATLRGVQSVAWATADRAWMAGDGGLIRTSDDAGETWAPPVARPDALLDDWFDWQTVTTVGDNVWVAGYPGSIVLRSGDGGRSWTQHATGMTTPINDLAFFDKRHGVAVGEFGVILTTDDGGMTWTSRRGADRHAAVLSLVGVDSHAAPELLAATALGGGRRTVVASPFTPPDPAELARAALRHKEAGQLLGLSSYREGWRLPLSPQETPLSLSRLRTLLDTRGGEPADSQARRDVARLLAVYRPSVLLVPADTSEEPGVTEWIRAVAESAARGEIEVPPATGLEPPRLRHVLVVGETDQPAAARELGANAFSTGDFIGALGATSAQWAEPTRRLLREMPATAPKEFTWRPLVGRPAPGRRGDLADVTGSPRGSADRRVATDPPAGRIDQLRRVAQRRRALDQLLTVEEIDEDWSRRVIDLTMGLDTGLGAALLEQLAEGYREVGRPDHAAETRFLLARRYPGDPLADAALIWLVRYYASTECGKSAADSVASRARRDTLANVASSRLRFEPRDPDKELTAARRRERALALAKYLESDRPALHADPSLGLCIAATQRAGGDERTAQRAAEWIARQAAPPAWRRAAGIERWLSDAGSLPPERPMAVCRVTETRPRLDARFDEGAWQTAEGIKLADADGRGHVATVRFSHDDEFLYVAIEATCNEAPPASDKRRPRDADLSPFDHISIRIDVDRDYTTAYELAVDCRGFTRDSVWGDRHWRPEWYVANDAETRSWRIEAAVALDSIVESEELEHAAWAVSVERRRPEELPVAWTDTPGDSPDAYGLLLLR